MQFRLHWRRGLELESHMKLLLAGLLLIPVAGQPSHEDYEMYRGAFSAEECETIANLFLEQPPEPDDRTIPLLPNMHDEFRVSRLSRFDDGTLMSREPRCQCDA